MAFETTTTQNFQKFIILSKSTIVEVGMYEEDA